ncbi:hypothetical protein D3C84_867370 [compost metagenome]
MALDETKKPTNSATSSGCAGLPKGIPPNASITLCVACSVVIFELSAIRSIILSEEVVIIQPGETVKILMPFGETSLDKLLL